MIGFEVMEEEGTGRSGYCEVVHGLGKYRSNGGILAIGTTQTGKMSDCGFLCGMRMLILNPI